MKRFFDKLRLAISEHPNWIAAVVCALFLVVILIAGHQSAVASDPMSGVYESYDKVEGEALDQLINTYYADYAAGDVDSLQKIAYPISDEEASYIRFLSQYIEEYQNISVYSKRGEDDTSYLVSATIDIKFSDIDTAAPGMDFFYVRTDDEGNLYIDNVYSSFNQASNENQMDPQITALIAAFEQQSDVVTLQNQVQVKCDEAYEQDDALDTFVNETLPAKITEWAADYRQSQAQQEASSSSSEQTQSSSSQSADENTDTSEDVDTYAGITVEEEEDESEGQAVNKQVTLTQTVNIRSGRSTDSSRIAVAYRTEPLTIIESYSDGWSKVSYNGQEGYAMTQYLPQ